MEAEAELPSPGSKSEASQKGLKFCSSLLEAAIPWEKSRGGIGRQGSLETLSPLLMVKHSRQIK